MEVRSEKLKCGLCQERKGLRDSHLIPKAVYKGLRTPDYGSNPHPVVTTRDRSFTGSQQVSAPFLCPDCEQLFSKNGEAYVLAEYARRDGQFKLRERLQTTTPWFSCAQFKTYAAEPVLGKQADKYLYFASSVFWRASAGCWKMGGKRVGNISLGTTYQEQFRLFLLGKQQFPDSARIFVHVSLEQQPDLTVVFPCTRPGRTHGAHCHKFYIPGILFILFLGGNVSKFDEGALNSTTHKQIWVSPWQEDDLFTSAVEMIQGARPSGDLGKRIRKHA
jgi:hypothetical protein